MLGGGAFSNAFGTACVAPDTSIISTVPGLWETGSGAVPELAHRTLAGPGSQAAGRRASARVRACTRGLRVQAAGGAVGGARAAALGAATPGSTSRLRSNHGGGGIHGPSGETESGSYAERERRAGLRRRRRHCRETPPTPHRHHHHQSAQRRACEPDPTAQLVREPAGASQKRRRGIRLPSPRSGGIRR